MRGGRAGLLIKLARQTMKLQPGRTRFKRVDFHVMPGEAAGPSSAERLQRGFFGGETCGIMLCCDHPARVAVITLPFGKDALTKSRRAREDFAHATDFYNVYADGNNHGKC